MVASTAVTWEDTPGDEPAARRAAEIASLTGLRGFAALMVVLIHVSGRTEFPWLGLPTYGPVSLFVLSGFLLYRPWARWTLRVQDRPRLGTFLLRRAARIFPAYWVVLLVVLIVYAPERPTSTGGWLRAASLTWIYVADPLREAMLHTWSLGTELSWYLALPVMAWVTGQVARRATGTTALWIAVSMMSLSLPISAAWRWWASGADLAGALTYPFWLPTYLFCFAGGALVSLLAEGHGAGLVRLDGLRGFFSDSWGPLVLALAASLVATSTLGGPSGFVTVTFAEDQVRTGASALVAVLLLATVVFGSPASPLDRLLGTRWFVAIGRWSYGIYLWHLPVIVVMERDLTFPDGPLGLVWRLTWVLALSIPLAAATYAWVERPAIAWSRRPFGRSDDGRRVLGRAPAASSRSTAAQPSTPPPAASRNDSPAE